MQPQRTRTLATALSGALLVFLSACSKPSDSRSAGGAAASASSGGSSSAALAATAPAADPPRAGGSTSFASGFEGAIVMHMTSARGPGDMLFLAKGGKLRIEVPGKDGQMTHSIFDPASDKVTLLMDTQRMAMQLPIPKIAGAAAGAKDTKVTRTGKHETVAGYDCEDWDIVTEGGKHERACVAQGLPFFDFMALAGSTSGTSRSWAEELRDKNGFPLRAVELDAAGKETSRMEVTKIEKKALDDSAFTVPVGYQVMNLPASGAGGGAAHPSRP